MSEKRKLEKDWEKQEFTLYGTTYKLSNVADSMKKNCEFHGFVQKLIDSTAGMTIKLGYTDAERKARINEVMARLKIGQWNKPGEGKETSKKKIDEAREKATPAELAVMKKLGLI